ncbi:MAG: hypothetical protein ABID38_02575 [Candidatus Diapherotrites archaeon]
MNRGFILAISTVLIALFLLSFSAIYLENSNERNSTISASFSPLKAGFIVDDIENDFNWLLGTEIDINQGAHLTSIYIYDKIPSDQNKYRVIDYADFIETGYAGKQNAAIDLNVDSAADGRSELEFWNGLEYDYGYEGSNQIDFFVSGEDTNALTYDIYVLVNKSSAYSVPWAWDSGGDVNVNLNYVDLNATATVSYSGKLDSSIANSYEFDYSLSGGDTFTIAIGSIAGNSRALRFSENFSVSDARAEIRVRMDQPSIQRRAFAEYPVDLNYSQLDVNYSSRIRLWGG